MSEHKIDIFVSAIDKISSKPIEKIYLLTKESYLKDVDIDNALGEVYDELMYFLITDLKFGCEKYVFQSGYSKELDLLKDVIAIDISNKSRADLISKMKEIFLILPDLNNNSFVKKEKKGRLTTIWNFVKNLFKKNLDVVSEESILDLSIYLRRFVFIGLSYEDDRYAEELAMHLIKNELFDEDELISFINKRVMNKKSNILRV